MLEKYWLLFHVALLTVPYDFQDAVLSSPFGTNANIKKGATGALIKVTAIKSKYVTEPSLLLSQRHISNVR